MPQSFSRILTHLVFSTKGRSPFLTADIRADLYPYMSGFLKNHGHSPVAVGGVEDHVHLLFGLARTESIAKVTGELKVSTGKWLQPRCAEFRWQAGYGAFSVGNAELEVVRRYVQDQENHHRKVSFQDEYRSLLVECGIEFDERYMWD